MSIVAYVGLQGHGKTFEVVAGVILPALSVGRHIVTNIAGLNFDAIDAYVLREKKQVIRSSELVRVVPSGTFEDDECFYVEDDDGKPMVENPRVPAGSLVIVDEASRYWGDGCRVPNHHMRFFREHRHYSARGVSCDLVLISLSVSDFQRVLRRAIERTFQARKLKELGLKKFCLTQFAKGSESPRSELSHEFKSYDPDIFPLYKSYSAGSGVNELVVDGRQMLISKKAIGLYVVVLLAGLFFLWKSIAFFRPPPVEAAKGEGTQAAKSKGSASGAAADAGAVSGSGGGVVSNLSKSVAGLSGGASSGAVEAAPHSWREVGHLRVGQRLVFVLRSEQGSTRFVSDAAGFKMSGVDQSVTVDGKTFAPWSGGRQSGGGR